MKCSGVMTGTFYAGLCGAAGALVSMTNMSSAMGISCSSVTLAPPPPPVVTPYAVKLALNFASLTVATFDVGKQDSLKAALAAAAGLGQVVVCVYIWKCTCPN